MGFYNDRYKYGVGLCGSAFSEHFSSYLLALELLLGAERVHGGLIYSAAFSIVPTTLEMN